ncbi:MAG: hypothetical protein HRT82_08910 [Henriciella sp.]|nr:hypothetical protein [Henriciella sp.]
MPAKVGTAAAIVSAFAWSGTSNSASNNWDEASIYDSLAPFNQVRALQIPVASLADHIRSIKANRGTAAGFDLLFLADGLRRDRSGRELVQEIKRISGLNWAQVAQMVGVSARTIHNWNNGEKVAASNHQKLGRLASTIRYIDRGYGDANRRLLLGEGERGFTLHSMLINEQYDEAKSVAGKGAGRGIESRNLTSKELLNTQPAHFGHELSEAIESDEHDIELVTKVTSRKAPARSRSDR